jgi:GMP synthase (glutamine-hydrolysing)
LKFHRLQSVKNRSLPMRVAIVENNPITHHGQVGVALHEVAAKIDLYKPWLDGILPKPGSFDALVSFGGVQNALDDTDYPYLSDLAALMYDAAQSGTAVLGICLGSQLLARGAGAQNLINGHNEHGWCQITLTEAGKSDPILANLPANFRSFEWHSDHFTLPASATHLAQTDTAGVQAFRIGRAGYGTQFHFEANRAVVADMTKTWPEAANQMTPNWVANHPELAIRHGIDADAHGLTIARAWVALI